jgi:cytochrome c oxidase assembly protein subunit 15
VKTLAWISLLLVVILVSLSAYLRLAHSGIGCSDWPACYGRIGDPPAASIPATTDDAYRKLVEASGQSLAWATPLHRLVASALGLCVFGLFAVAVIARRHRLLTATLLALTAWLAVLGIRSGSLHDPAVVIGNLAGGFAMLGLLGWLVWSFGTRGPALPRVSIAATVATLLLASQVLLGGLTSANFAATACKTLPDCHGSWWPGPELARALDLGRVHEVTAAGQAVGGPERIAIHKAHRLGAAALLLATLAAAGIAWRSSPRLRVTATAVAVLVLAEFWLGVATVFAELPITLAVLHNWLAALLLLALLKLVAISTGPGTIAHPETPSTPEDNAP